ncbi:MAG: proline iminopeptidase [Nitrospirales bacterium]|nr:MAG: proline iminopeptidase [Nitrospirales bacterium]
MSTGKTNGSEKVQLDEVELLVRRLGNGNNPLLVIHGGPDWDHTYLIPPFEIIADQYPVLLFDIRGCGGSTRFGIPEKYSSDQAVEDVVQLLDKEGISKAWLLGFSFGGRILLRFAKKYPHRVKAMVLASTLLADPPKREIAIVPEHQVRLDSIPSMQDVFVRSDLSPAEKTKTLAIKQLPLDVYDLEKVSEIEKIVQTVDFSFEWGMALQSGLLEPDHTNYMPWLMGQDFPVLVLHGQHDMRFPVPDIAEGKNIRIKVLEKCGHFAHLENPTEWADSILDFLRAHSQEEGQQ